MRTSSGTSTEAARIVHLAVALAVVATVFLILVTAALIAAAPDAPLQGAWGFRGFAAVLAVAFGAVGALIALRVPGNRIGGLMVGIGFWAASVAFCVEYAAYGLAVVPDSVPLALFVAWLVSWVWVPFAGLSTTFLMLLFPDGRLPSRRWRPVAWLAGAAIVLTAVGLALRPGPIDNAPYLDNPLEVPDPWGTVVTAVSTVGFVLLAVAVLLSAASLVQRFGRSTGVARQQLKWFAAAAVFAGLTLAGPGTLFNAILSGDPATPSVKAFEILTILAFLTVPMAIGIAVLRYRLYEIDRLISRTLGYAVVTGLLALVFAGTVLGLQALLEPLTGENTVAVAASTLIVAALFQPLRRRVQRAVDRRFDRARHDGQLVVDAFTRRLRDEVDLDTVRAELLATTDDVVRPVSASIWLRRGRADG